MVVVPRMSLFIFGGGTDLDGAAAKFRVSASERDVISFFYVRSQRENGE